MVAMYFVPFVLLNILFGVDSFRQLLVRLRPQFSRGPTTMTSRPERYINPLAELAGKFLPSSTKSVSNASANNQSKRKKTSMQRLATDLQQALSKREWFVTGDVDKSFFSDSFQFEDPDVKVQGIDDYAAGVKKIFNQNKNPRAEVLSVVINPTNVDQLIVTWRIDVSVNILFGLKIKPYIIYTDFTVDPKTSLITAQKDRFSIPGYDIVLSSLFPFLGSFFSPPAPPVITSPTKK